MFMVCLQAIDRNIKDFFVSLSRNKIWNCRLPPTIVGAFEVNLLTGIEILH